MLEIRNLRKMYTPKKGLKDLSIDIPAGSITAIAGPNGAGKSTFFNLLNGILTPQNGSCKLDGVDINSVSLNQTGFLPEADYLVDRFTVTQMIDYMIQMKGISVDRKEIDELISGFSLERNKNTVIEDLSQGMYKRVEIICAIIGFPSLIVLDEPLNALDIQSVIYLKKILYSAKAAKCHILISSHVLDFFDDLVDSVVFMKDGQVVKQSANTGISIEALYRETFGI